MHILWPAETSQQPISQTTWLKVTPHCNQQLDVVSGFFQAYVQKSPGAICDETLPFIYINQTSFVSVLLNSIEVQQG
jgi:hypothetical protein